MSYIQCILYLFYFCVFFCGREPFFCFGCVFVFFCFLAFIVGHKLRHLLVPFDASKKSIPKLKYINMSSAGGRWEFMCVFAEEFFSSARIRWGCWEFNLKMRWKDVLGGGASGSASVRSPSEALRSPMMCLRRNSWSKLVKFKQLGQQSRSTFRQSWSFEKFVKLWAAVHSSMSLSLILSAWSFFLSSVHGQCRFRRRT